MVFQRVETTFVIGFTKLINQSCA